MIETTDRAELQNAIRNAQECMMEMGQLLDSQTAVSKEQLMQLCSKTGVLLEEAQHRCEKLF